MHKIFTPKALATLPDPIALLRYIKKRTKDASLISRVKDLVAYLKWMYKGCYPFKIHLFADAFQSLRIEFSSKIRRNVFLEFTLPNTYYLYGVSVKRAWLPFFKHEFICSH